MAFRISRAINAEFQFVVIVPYYNPNIKLLLQQKQAARINYLLTSHKKKFNNKSRLSNSSEQSFKNQYCFHNTPALIITPY